MPFFVKCVLLQKHVVNAIFHNGKAYCLCTADPSGGNDLEAAMQVKTL
jgi:hypothetical protein